MPLTPNLLIHPEDKAALEKLKAIPMFPEAVKAFMKLYPEELWYGLNMANCIRLSSEQLPKIYNLLPPICPLLDIREPELYLSMNPIPNAFTYGDSRVFITLNSGLLELLEEDELAAVIAHECAHIFFRHTLFHSMAQMLLQFGERLSSIVKTLSVPIQLALLYWSRRSELSCDRVAAVVMGSPDPVVETMIRLAGGPKVITQAVNVEAYLQQADAYDQLLDSRWQQVLQGLAVMEKGHPFLTVRAREIRRWCQTDDYRKILRLMEDEQNQFACASCGKQVHSAWQFCIHCGAPVAAA